MKKLTLAAVGASISLTAFGQDLLQCVNPDVLNSLIARGLPQLQLAVTAELPASLADYRAPAGFILVGTAVRGDAALTTVAYRTSRDSEAAHAALVASFAADGWEIEDAAQNRPTRAVFELPGGPVTGTVCRDGQRLSLRVVDVDGTRYATINRNEDAAARACNSVESQLGALRSIMPDRLAEAAPLTLTFPPGTRSASGFGGLIISGSSLFADYQASTRIVSPNSSADLAERLGGQLREQGWRVDSSWNGRVSSGARFTRVAGDGLTHWVSLEIVALDAETYDVSLRQMTPPL
jgi:hypothetical protein